MVRKIKAKLVLRLLSEGLSCRQIAAQGMSRGSVDEVIAAADSEGLSYDDVVAMSDADVYEPLFAGRGEHHSVYAQPEWDAVHRELARVGGDVEAAAWRVLRRGRCGGFAGDGV